MRRVLNAGVVTVAFIGNPRERHLLPCAERDVPRPSQRLGLGLCAACVAFLTGDALLFRTVTLIVARRRRRGTFAACGCGGSGPGCSKGVAFYNSRAAAPPPPRCPPTAAPRPRRRRRVIVCSGRDGSWRHSNVCCPQSSSHEPSDTSTAASSCLTYWYCGTKSTVGSRTFHGQSAEPRTLR